jgi:hypothetical protein
MGIYAPQSDKHLQQSPFLCGPTCDKGGEDEWQDDDEGALADLCGQPLLLVVVLNHGAGIMDLISIKTLNPKCRLVLKIDQ